VATLDYSSVTIPGAFPNNITAFLAQSGRNNTLNLVRPRLRVVCRFELSYLVMSCRAEREPGPGDAQPVLGQHGRRAGTAMSFVSLLACFILLALYSVPLRLCCALLVVCGARHRVALLPLRCQKLTTFCALDVRRLQQQGAPALPRADHQRSHVRPHQARLVQGGQGLTLLICRPDIQLFYSYLVSLRFGRLRTALPSSPILMLTPSAKAG
jgi:hypothetical protein